MYYSCNIHIFIQCSFTFIVAVVVLATPCLIKFGLHSLTHLFFVRHVILELARYLTTVVVNCGEILCFLLLHEGSLSSSCFIWNVIANHT